MNHENMSPIRTALGIITLDGDPVIGHPHQLAAKWRGVVASLFPDDPTFHGHDGERTIARYPEVQYRWIDHRPIMFAVGAAVARTMSHPWPGVRVRIGEHERTVLHVEWTTAVHHAKFSSTLIRYELVTPWIALNQENHEKYRSLGREERRAELDRILVSNLLSLSRGLGWFHDATVYAAFEQREELSCRVKDVSLIGFEGSFVTNLELPDDCAIGRSVSHGFGWFRSDRARRAPRPRRGGRTTPRLP
jgi:hypothetical protein